MVGESNYVRMGCALAVLLAGAAVRGDDYLIYSKFVPPDLSSPYDVTGVGAYVEDYGVRTTPGDEIQYIYFLCGTVGYKYRVWVTNDGGPDDPTPTYIEIKQHPNHPDPRFVGPIEPRHFEFVSKGVLAGHTSGSSGHSEEFYVDSTGVYLGAYEYGIHKWDHNWNYVQQIARPTPERTESLAYNAAEKTWYAGGRYRKIYQLRDTNGNGDLMDESWQPIFSYPDYAGSHHDGIEYAGGSLWISDMTSDVLGKWRYNTGTSTWSEVGRYTYHEPADVEGMGFGPYDHFWIGSGWGKGSYVYELGDYCPLPCVVADAGKDENSWPPNVELEFDASGSHTTHPDVKIVLYEWDFDGDGVYDYAGTDPVVTHAYPATLINANDPNTIDWNATAACFTAMLKVTVADPNGNCSACDAAIASMTDVDTRTVCITPPPWGPVANPGGPYNPRVNKEVCLDGSKSYHPAGVQYRPGHPWYDKIVRWDWDLDGDGQFDDATGEVVCTSWSQEGNYVVCLRVTDQGGRSDEKCTTVVVDHGIHDVAVTSLTPSKTSGIHAGEVVSIDATVSNLGDYPESFNVIVSCDDQPIGTQRVNDLLPDAEAPVEVLWDTTGVSPGLHVIKVCADVVPGEIRIENNCLETTVEVVSMYTLTLSSADNGHVSVPGEGTFTYARDTVVPIQVVPDACFAFSHWEGTTTGIDPNKPNPTIVMDRDYTLEAHFKKIQYTLTTDSDQHGSVTVPGEGTFTYSCGDVVNVCAVPSDEHRHFVKWSGTAVDAGAVKDPIAACTTVTMNANYTLFANFSIEQRSLIITCTEGGTASLTRDIGTASVTWAEVSVVVVDYGTVITITARPRPGYVFTHWTGNIWSAEPQLKFALTDDYRLEAHFAPAP